MIFGLLLAIGLAGPLLAAGGDTVADVMERYCNAVVGERSDGWDRRLQACLEEERQALLFLKKEYKLVDSTRNYCAVEAEEEGGLSYRRMLTCVQAEEGGFSQLLYYHSLGIIDGYGPIYKSCVAQAQKKGGEHSRAATLACVEQGLSQGAAEVVGDDPLKAIE